MPARTGLRKIEPGLSRTGPGTGGPNFCPPLDRFESKIIGGQCGFIVLNFLMSIM